MLHKWSKETFLLTIFFIQVCNVAERIVEVSSIVISSQLRCFVRELKKIKIMLNLEQLKSVILA